MVDRLPQHLEIIITPHLIELETALKQKNPLNAGIEVFVKLIAADLQQVKIACVCIVQERTATGVILEH